MYKKLIFLLSKWQRTVCSGGTAVVNRSLHYQCVSVWSLKSGNGDLTISKNGKERIYKKRLFKYSLESRLLQIKFCIITTRVSKYNLPNAPGRVQKPVWDGIDPLSISMIVYLPSERQDLRPNQLFHMYFTHFCRSNLFLRTLSIK